MINLFKINYNADKLNYIKYILAQLYHAFNIL